MDVEQMSALYEVLDFKTWYGKNNSKNHKFFNFINIL